LVDSPQRSTSHSHSRQSRQFTGVLRLRTSDDDYELLQHSNNNNNNDDGDDDDDDDALLSLELQLTRGTYGQYFSLINKKRGH